MTILYYIIAAVLGAVVALGCYIAVRKIMLKGKKDEILEKARLTYARPLQSLHETYLIAVRYIPALTAAPQAASSGISVSVSSAPNIS